MREIFCPKTSLISILQKVQNQYWIRISEGPATVMAMRPWSG
jgi:hypothetical protein